MNVKIKSSASKDINRINREDKSKIIKAIKELKDVQSLSEVTNLLKMEGTRNSFRLKVGDYRVMLKWDKKIQTIEVSAISHRQGAYKKK